MAWRRSAMKYARSAMASLVITTGFDFFAGALAGFATLGVCGTAVATLAGAGGVDGATFVAAFFFGAGVVLLTVGTSFTLDALASLDLPLALDFSAFAGSDFFDFGIFPPDGCDDSRTRTCRPAS